MRVNKKIFDLIDTGRFIGSNRPSGRVTVEPDFMLKMTIPTYGDTLRGPYRYYVDAADTRVEVEVPQIKSIQIDRSLSQDIATCKIVMYNQFHNGNSIMPELASQLGKPGYFWPRRGESSESNLLWNQTAATGATLRDGTVDDNFEWTNVLIPNALLRTYSGYGGHDLSIDGALAADNIMMTGVWLIDRISGGTDGTILVECRDVGRLLLEQIVFPPLVPDSLYPLEYFPPGKSAFDSSFGAKPVTGVGMASISEVRLIYDNSSFGSGSIAGHYASESADMNRDNFSWSPAWTSPTAESSYHWWQYRFSVTGADTQVIDAVSFRPWAGGYTAYVSVYSAGAWQGSETVPQVGAGNIPYLKKIQVPYNIPDGFEEEVTVQLDAPVTAQYVRITLGPSYYYSGVSDGSGDYYRSGLRTAIAQRTGSKVPDYYAPFDQVLWTFAMASHPIRGYWVADDDGWVYGFGDAADYDSSTYGAVPLGYSAGIGGHNNIHLVAIAAHPSGKGYWALANTGQVYSYGAATNHGEYYVGVHAYMDGAYATDIAATHTGNGYWVSFSDGSIYGFGDATPSYTYLPFTAITNYMINHGPRFLYLYPAANPVGFEVRYAASSAYSYSRRCTSIVGHPTKMGFWATDGSGQVFPYGACEFFGELNYRTYNQGGSNEFKLNPSEWAVTIECTQSGNGYWLMFNSGHIAAYGDAINQGTAFIYEGNSQLGALPISSADQDWSFFRALAWNIARDPDGSGFWVLIADGSVMGYNADFWGQPSWKNRVGYRWHDGNAKDRSEIVKDLLAWSGFTYYDSSDPGSSGTYATMASGATGSAPWNISSGVYTLALQLDGNLVLYKGLLAVYDSNTAGHTTQVTMKTNGDLVVTEGGVTLWSSGTWMYPGASLRLYAAGQLAIADSDGEIIRVLYSSEEEDARPPVLGNIESTGVPTTTVLQGDKWDKRTVIDCINELKQSVGYDFRIDEEGLPQFHSPNFWQAGNNSIAGTRLFAKYEVDGSWSMVNEGDAGAEPFIPELHEAVNLINYQASLDGEALRSEIIIGSDLPDKNDPSKTKYVRFIPPSATEEVRPGIPALRGINRPAAWVNTSFDKETENLLMAELISLRIWFSQRIGSATIAGNPGLSLGDQVRMIERNTSETYIHLINSISSTLDLDSGSYQMQINTSWLGDANDWVITSNNTYNPITHIGVSERVDRWQLALERGLAFHGDGTSIATLNGGFN